MDAELACLGHQQGAPVGVAAVERMLLDQQDSLRRGKPREALQHIVDRHMHRTERRMVPDLVIAGELQRKDEEVAAGDGCQRFHRLSLSPPAQ